MPGIARNRRWLVVISTAISAAVTASLPAFAQQDYPSRPLHVLVGFPAGSGADIGARYIGAKLQEVSGQTVVVENKPGAGSNIAIGLVASARPDGYTILLAASSAMAGSRFLYKDFKLDTETALEPAALLYRTVFAITVAPSSPLTSVAELTAFLKGRQRSLNAYTNQTGQIAAAYYLSSVGAASTAVAYRSAADAVADLAAGTLDFMALDGGFAIGQYKAGRIKPLAVTAAQRSTAMPTVPTMQEAGVPDFEFAPFWAAYVPKGTPPAIIARLTGWLVEVIGLEATKARFEGTGNIALGGGPEAARAALADEIVKWRRAVTAAKVEPQ